MRSKCAIVLGLVSNLPRSGMNNFRDMYTEENSESYRPKHLQKRKQMVKKSLHNTQYLLELWSKERCKYNLRPYKQQTELVLQSAPVFTTEKIKSCKIMKYLQKYNQQGHLRMKKFKKMRIIMGRLHAIPLKNKNEDHKLHRKKTSYQWIASQHRLNTLKSLWSFLP